MVAVYGSANATRDSVFDALEKLLCLANPVMAGNPIPENAADVLNAANNARTKYLMDDL